MSADTRWRTLEIRPRRRGPMHTIRTVAVVKLDGFVGDDGPFESSQPTVARHTAMTIARACDQTLRAPQPYEETDARSSRDTHIRELSRKPQDLHLYVGLFISPFILGFSIVFYLVHGFAKRPSSSAADQAQTVGLNIPADTARFQGPSVPFSNPDAKYNGCGFLGCQA